VVFHEVQGPPSHDTTAGEVVASTLIGPLGDPRDNLDSYLPFLRLVRKNDDRADAAGFRVARGRHRDWSRAVQLSKGADTDGRLRAIGAVDVSSQLDLDLSRVEATTKKRCREQGAR